MESFLEVWRERQCWLTCSMIDTIWVALTWVIPYSLLFRRMLSTRCMQIRGWKIKVRLSMPHYYEENVNYFTIYISKWKGPGSERNHGVFGSGSDSNCMSLKIARWFRIRKTIILKVLKSVSIIISVIVLDP